MTRASFAPHGDRLIVFATSNSCSRLSTARGPYLCNISWIQANWYKLYYWHKKKTQKPTRPWP